MAGGKKAAETLTRNNPDYFSQLAKKRKGKTSPKSGLASMDEQKRRWITLRGVVSRGHTLRPEFQAELDDLNRLFTSGVRSSVRKYHRVSEALKQVLDD